MTLEKFSRDVRAGLGSEIALPSKGLRLEAFQV